MKRDRQHSWPVRLCHWLNVLVMVLMVMSGWGIYNASPLFDFSFPAWLTLGGWLGGHIAWHLAVMWLLAGNALLYLIWGVSSGHFRRDFFSFTPRQLVIDGWQALGGKLHHTPGRYNAVQKLMYVGVLVVGFLLVLSGLAIWKPVQLSGLVALMGGFDIARYVHFYCMAAVLLFALIHAIMVLLVPKTLVAMITGGRKEEHQDG